MKPEFDCSSLHPLTESLFSSYPTRPLNGYHGRKMRRNGLRYGKDKVAGGGGCNRGLEQFLFRAAPPDRQRKGVPAPGIGQESPLLTVMASAIDEPSRNCKCVNQNLQFIVTNDRRLQDLSKNFHLVTSRSPFIIRTPATTFRFRTGKFLAQKAALAQTMLNRDPSFQSMDDLFLLRGFP
jgi:hypothetical protein